MLRFMRAGLIAAAYQFGGVVIITFLFSILDSSGLGTRTNLATGMTATIFRTALAPLFTWSYLLVAIGLAFTASRSVRLTAVRILEALKIVRFGRPKLALNALAIQFGFAAILFAVFALREPPELLVQILGDLGFPQAAPAIWSAAMSVLVAAFGANVHAVILALRIAESRH